MASDPPSPAPLPSWARILDRPDLPSDPPPCWLGFSCGLLNWTSSAKVGSLSPPGGSSDECYKEDLKSDLVTTPKTEEELLSSSPLRKFCFNDLKTATRNFRPDSLLGEGGFGHVFKGWIEEHGTAPAKPGTGLVVAVKILNQNGFQGHKEWLAEISYLSEIYHHNLVKLIGYCTEDEQRLLVYEFMQKGSLENHLFRRRAQPLPWAVRMKIAVGAAKGLAVLHGGERPVIFRDFKTSNILLDSEFNAKLSDFGLAKDGPGDGQTHVSTRVMGTYGYAAPEYVMTGHLTARSDIYSFGVVLLEIITGRRSMDKTRPSGQHNLVEWARPFMNDKKRLFEIVDPRLNGIYSPKGVQKAAGLSARCLCRDPKTRPNIEEVLKVLTSIEDLKDIAVPAHHFSNPPTDPGMLTHIPARVQGYRHVTSNAYMRPYHQHPTQQIAGNA